MVEYWCFYRNLTHQMQQDIRWQQRFSNFERALEKLSQAILYGSRALGNYKPSSDIDLSLKGGGIDLSLQIQIEFDLDDLMLPYKFDLSIYDKISNPEFLQHIDRMGKTMYQKDKR